MYAAKIFHEKLTMTTKKTVKPIILTLRLLLLLCIPGASLMALLLSGNIPVVLSIGSGGNGPLAGIPDGYRRALPYS